MGSFTPLKYLYGKELAEKMASAVRQVYPPFSSASFVRKIEKRVEPLELKPRIAVFAEELQKHITGTYPEQISVLLNILGPENPNETGMFREYYILSPVAYFVEVYGHDHYTDSIHAIKEITKRNTGEYAIRPYIRKYPDETMMHMLEWASDPNFHIRRLASEGCRPRLPWASKLDEFINDPSSCIPILEKLKDDPVMYVKKSVANHVNDILKDNRAKGMELLHKWSADRSASAHRKWIIRHALRNLRKNEDAEAKEILQRIGSK